MRNIPLILIFFSVVNSYASNLSDFLNNTQQDLMNKHQVFVTQQQSNLLNQTTSNFVFNSPTPSIIAIGCGLINRKRLEINYDSLITLQFQGEYETWTPILNNYKKESYWKIISNPK